jgi:hypothetical protein
MRHDDMRNNDMQNDDRGSKRIDVGSAKPGMTATALANNAAENNKKAQATQNVHKAWYHIW